MSELKKLDLPDILEIVYTTSSRKEATQVLINTLEVYNNLEAKILRNKLQTDLLRYILSQKLQNETKKTVRGIHKHTVRNHPDLGITTVARQKAWMSYIHKDLINLKEGKTLDKVLDARACRIIIDSTKPDPENLVKELGNIVNETLSYLLDIGFQLIPAPCPKDTKLFIPSNHPDVYLPKKDYIKPEFKIYVKDYVSSPKCNGYQSYHVLVISPTGEVLEIQFRTLDMDCFAEYKLAGHDKYKENQIKKYSLPTLDREKVHWANYRYEKFFQEDEDGINKKEKILFEDNSGLEKSLYIDVLHYNP